MQIFGTAAALNSVTNRANGTSSTTGASGSSGSAPNPISSATDPLTQESTFLQLLVSQIKNQDPLNPTDSIQFVGQLVQYSELEQLLGINQNTQKLLSTQTPPPASGSGTKATQ